MLTNHRLLIDQDCPLCRFYSKAFVRLAWTDADCAIPYQSEEAMQFKTINQERARNEIALLDLETGKTTYGVSSLIKILAHDKKWLQYLLHFPPVYFLLSILYKFISYNRKVIAPYACQTSSRSCNPDFNLSYRWAYIIFVALATALIVNNFTSFLFPHFGWPHNLTTEMIICFGQVTWQSIAAYFITNRNKVTYLGNMSTVSMLGALLLLPVILLMNVVDLSVYIKLVMFFSVIGFMFFEHIRRCHLLGISSWMTVSWVAYRVTALSTLIYLIHNKII